MRNEWFWAALLFACPFVIFGLAEAIGMIRRRRRAALARRLKKPRPVAKETTAQRRRLTRG